jgi:hypothetical protein
MRKLLVSASLVVLACGVSGCGGANGDSLMKEQVKDMNDLAAALESKAPEAKVKELSTKLQETEKKLKALNLSEDEKKKLAERHRDELVKASMRLAQAGMNKAMGDFGNVFGGFPGAGELPAGFPGAGKKKD